MTTGTPRYPSRQHDLPPPETEEVTTLRVACDGAGGALGHPRVWLTIDPQVGHVDCGYCDKRFVLAGDGH
ncbi:zinc-finger domain-containing protein [Jannaschia sp. W003]|uniref:zinc-finger domain-containing protein n=1 Tax=Jannaschia sp. W003 TaxID=2867012 RepID=UPI0021A57BFB|nr:zinc-finger domain-containing protein [Jannaschia sp. W003]UWQ21929.1 zinc-finger domain-containing protein [Jannaschia sp. W003]